jgi:hypothetical protein
VFLCRSSSKATINGLVGQAIGLLVKLTPHVHDSITRKSLQSRGNFLEQDLQPEVPHSVLTPQLFHHQFRVEKDPKPRNPEVFGSPEPHDEPLILGLVVGRCAEKSIEFNKTPAASIKEDGARTGWSRIASGRSVGVEGSNALAGPSRFRPFRRQPPWTGAQVLGNLSKESAKVIGA